MGDPNVPAASALDASIADIGKIVRLLREAERLHAVAPAGGAPGVRRRKPVWVTELNWQSAPPSTHGVPARLQAAWVSRALHRLWVAGVSLVSWEFLIDPYPALTLSAPTGPNLELARPAGLFYAGVLDGRSDPALARPKPFLRGFALPFDPLRVDRRRVRVWALVGRPQEWVSLQRQERGGRWFTLARLRTDAGGIVNALLVLRGRAVLRLHADGLDSAVMGVG